MKTFKKYELVAETVEKYEGTKLNSSSAIANFIRPLFGQKVNTLEQVFAIYLDTSYNPIGVQLIGQGGISFCAIDERLIFKGAVSSCCKNVIMAHNHPSGNLDVSSADRMITKSVKNGLDTLKVNLVDHIVLTEDSYTSFADSGLFN